MGILNSQQNINEVYFESRLNQNIKRVGSLVDNKPNGQWLW